MAFTLADDLPAPPYTRQQPKITYVRPGDSRLHSALVGTMERLCGRAALQRVYEGIKAEQFDQRYFFRRVLESARITVEHDRSRERLIPRGGPLIFVANHPFGVVDGAILCDLAARTRGEFRILIHAMLCQDADLASCFLPVDFNQTPAALRNNIATKRIALDTLRSHGTLLIYPSGGVSTARKCGFGEVRDLPWSTFIAKLVQQSDATVVPVFFHGANSRMFHVLSHLHESLRTGLLLREARRQFGKTIRMRIGDPITPRAMSSIRSRRELTEFLHRVTWELGSTGTGTACPLPGRG